MNSTKIANHKSQIATWLPATVWAAVILLASSDLFSAAHTRSIIEGLFHWLFPSWTPYSLYKAHLVVRKCAHFFEYAVLAILVMRGFTGAKAPSAAAANGPGKPAPRQTSEAPRPNAAPSTRSTASRSLGMTSDVGNHRSLRRTILRVVLVCAMVAIMDEGHQHFVPSRTSSPYDVLLDTTGATVAMLLLTWRKSSRSAEHKTA